MTAQNLKMRFDPRTVRHLGLKMYSHLPAALSEIISNAYDAYATKVGVILKENKGSPESIIIMDDGIGLSFSDINEKFLVIGRNRRDDEPLNNPLFKRKPTGKKGLGKLALFGVARTITIETVQKGKCTEFVLDYDVLTASKGDYPPTILKNNVDTDKPDGTKLTLTNLKRKSKFDVSGLIDSLSRIFIFDPNFQVAIVSPDNTRNILNNEHKYATIDIEFEWDVATLETVKSATGNHKEISGKLITTKKPIPPSSGLRGITLYSRGKLVNLPEYFSESTSSHFYSYLTGWINVDFIDDMEEDVISTNRQSLVWDDPEISKLLIFLRKIISSIRGDWRTKRKKEKQKQTEKITGIDTQKWVGSVPDEMKPNLEKLLEALDGADVSESFEPAVQALHSIVPDYPLLHWRHLHPKLKNRVEKYYKNKMYGEAADQAAKIYCEVLRNITGSKLDGRALIQPIFAGKPPRVRINDFKTKSDQNIQEGQALLSEGLIAGFRNPASHDAIDTIVPSVFSELDCLNILSLTSHLLFRMDKAIVDDLEYFKTH